MKIILFLTAVAVLFFYKFFLFGQIPFPGDLLISEYKPWRTESFLGYNPGSYPQKAQYFDTLRQLYPWKTFTIETLRHATIPLWNPYNFSGAPLLANSQSAVFYPFNIIYFLFSQPVGWAILVMLQPLLSSIGTYLFARKIGISRNGSLFSGVTYGYCLFMTSFLEYNTVGHVMIWLPFALYGTELLHEKISSKSMLVFISSIALAAFAGHLQLFGYLVLFTYAYFLLKKRFSFLFFIILLLPFALSAIQLIPTFELLSYAARAPQEYEFLIEKLLIQPYQLILFLGADLFGNPATYNYLLSDSYPGNAIYVGIIPFLFTLGALHLWRKNKFVKFFSLASIVILFLIVRTPFSELLYRLPLPLISTSSPTNMIFLLSFCLSVLAGFGLDAINHHHWKRILIPVCIVFIILWIVRVTNPGILNRNNLVYSAVLFATSAVFILKSKRHSLLIFCLLTITVLDSWYFFQKFNSFVPRKLVFPEAQVLTWFTDHAGADRFWGYKAANVESNFATQYKLYSPEGYDPLYPKWYGELLWAKEGKLHGVFDNTTRSDAVIAQDITRSQKILNVLGTRYIIDRSENASDERTFPPHRYRLVYEDNGWKIFENLASVPRVMLVNNFKSYTNASEFENAFFDDAFNPRQTVLLQRSPNIPIDSESELGTATIISYTPNVVTIKISAPAHQLLVLSDTYFPGWVATVDGIQAPVLKANWAFRAVEVPKGTNTVIFEYKPKSFSIGAKTSMMGLVALGIMCMYLKRQKT